MLALKFGEIRVDKIFLIPPRLMTQILLGVDFCVGNKVTISFPDKCFTMDVSNEVSKHTFLHGTDDLTSFVSNSASDHPNCSDVKSSSVIFFNTSHTEGLIDGRNIQIPQKGAGSEVSTVRDSFGLAGSQVRSFKRGYFKMPLRQDACDVI